MNTIALPRTASAMKLLTGDRVILACILLLVGIALLDPPQLVPSLKFTGSALLGIAPFLLLAVGIAALAKATGADAHISRAFAGNQTRAVMGAALVGALSPFCSCGVIPLIAAMLRAGVPLAPVMAFWIASPLMDPEMFVLTAAGIGTGFAVAKTVATIAMGLMAGYAVMGLERVAGPIAPLPDEPSPSGGCCGPKSGADTPMSVHWRFWDVPERRAAFTAEAVSNGRFLLRWLTFAFVLESLMLAYVPGELIAQAVGGGNWFAIPLATLVGVPAYLNGYAAIPLVSGLMDLGMSPGAAMSFVTAGAVSSIPAAVAVWALVRRRVFFLYVMLGLMGSALVGLAYQLSGAPV
jgi:uncharacterized membrane protein YraQ (UPF0718 family)